MEQKQYWRGLEELNPTPEFAARQKNEFMEGLPLDEVLNESADSLGLSSNRRDFLKFFGFGVGAVALAACTETPVRNVIPYVTKPENITPGVPLYYASTCGACATGCGILVKTREGRPIKVDGNDKTFNKGAICAQGQASVLSLYDNHRNKAPMKGGKNTNWEQTDVEVMAGLNEAVAAGLKIAIVTGSLNSPSTKRAIAGFSAKYKNAEHVQYDAISASGILSANKECFGTAVVPTYHFDKAKVIVSFDADFLGTWISPVEYTKDWVTNRRLNDRKEMSRHIHFESHLSVTGSNADVRIPVKPSQLGMAVVALYNEVAKQLGQKQIDAPAFNTALNTISTTATELVNAKGQSLVVCGSNSTDVQVVVNAINTMLGNIGSTVDLDNHSNQRTATDAGFDKLVEDMNAGAVGAVVFYNVNPVYSYHAAGKLKEGLKKVKLKVTTAYGMDETASLCTHIAPDNHYLESWNDHEPKAGQYQLAQPAISKVFNTRQGQESILVWSGNNTDFYSYIKETWKPVISGDFTTAWNQALHDGVRSELPKTAKAVSFGGDVAAAGSAVAAYKASGIELNLYEKVAIGDGTHANNPWLQELPDPISKACWDNYAAINKATADELQLTDGDLVSIKAGNTSIDSIPVLVQPGQVRGTVSVALGYGRHDNLGNVAKGVGKNAYGFRISHNGNTLGMTAGASITKVGSGYTLAQTQTHHTIEGRDYLKETTLDRWVKDPKSANHTYAHIVSLWDEKDYKGHRWAMAIDLNACTGCGACVIACQAENNVAVVGRDEVLRGREMHWIRIDRYYSFTDKGTDSKGSKRYTREKEIDKNVKDWENISVTFQPVMCQHCAHASCESVCPVLATTHSSEGLNQMTYNRCIGTKYCANNCAYKVRRFNWFRYAANDQFDYNMNNDLGRMVLNPDVTVRSRGVMEKCSFCVQKINLGKLTAKRENRELEANEIKTACQTACPSNAIVFGDRNNPESEISKLFYNEREYGLMTDEEKEKTKNYFGILAGKLNQNEKDNAARAFAMLEEINVKPSVKYLTKVRNRTDVSIEEEIAKDLSIATFNEKQHAKHHAKSHKEGGHGEEHGGEHKPEGGHH